jgi:hypothetical protein
LRREETMTRQRINIKQALREKNTRDEADRISRIREIRKLDTQGKFHAFSFDFETVRDLDNEDAVYDALAWHIDEMWNEACWCYAWGLFRGCIVLAVGAVEAGLKYRLREAGRLEDGEDATFGRCIERAQRCGLLPQQQNQVVQSVAKLNRVRNDIIHANRARRDPEGALSADGPEHEVVDLGYGLHTIHEFRFGARDALKDSRSVLAHLRRHKMHP